MLCSATLHDQAFGEGCNISVLLSNGDFPSLAKDVSPKKASFLDNLLRRSSSRAENKEKSAKSHSWPIFSKKAPSTASTRIEEQSQADKSTTELIAQLELEGRSEAEINFHLSHIHDSLPPVAHMPTQQQGSTNILSQFFRNVQTVFKEEFGVGEIYYVYPELEDDLQRLTIGISSAPFYAALPPDVDLSYEALSQLEPVYVGSKCINNLPCCVHDGSPLPGDQNKCPVCLNDFAEGDSLKSLPCVHFYHKDCIDSWLLVGHACPVCKLLVE